MQGPDLNLVRGGFARRSVWVLGGRRYGKSNPFSRKAPKTQGLDKHKKSQDNLRIGNRPGKESYF